MDVYWLEQDEADMFSGEGWFGAKEVLLLDRMRLAKRRADWKLGRWTAKRAVATYLNIPGNPSDLAEVEILPAPSGLPQVWIAHQLAPVAISISHSFGRAVCAVASSSAALGCDLELIEPRSESFVMDYFATEERALISRVLSKDRALFVTLLWSAKESALKTLGMGLRLDTRCVVVDLVEEAYSSDRKEPVELFRASPWQQLKVHSADGQGFVGWWQSIDDFVRTIVAAPAPSPPICLD